MSKEQNLNTETNLGVTGSVLVLEAEGAMTMSHEPGPYRPLVQKSSSTYTVVN
jgi:hypothetical protein